MNGSSQLNDYNLRKKPFLRHERTVVILLSILLAISCLIVIFLIQYDVYDAYFKQRYNYMISGVSICYYVNVSDINLIMTPFAAFLLIIFTILYKRRVLCVNVCKSFLFQKF